MSVLTLVSKIIGRTIQVQFLAFFNRTRIPVSLTEPCFRTKLHSTETAVVYLTDYILEHMDRQMITGAVFIGLKKAFELVYHECLLFKLEHYGVRGGSLDWFRNYLTTRTQTVQFANTGYQPEPSILASLRVQFWGLWFVFCTLMTCP